MGTYFDTLMTNSIGILLTDSQFRTYSNGGEESSCGFEFEISAELADNLLLRSTFTHFTETPDRSFRESTDMASLIVNYNMDKWNFNLSSNWQGAKQFQYKATDIAEFRDLDSFVLVNTKVGYTLASAITLFAQVDNLFDKGYFTPPQETKY